MNKKLVFFFLSALAIAGCAKEPQTGDPVGTDAQDANFSLLASTDVFTKTELCNCKDIVWKADDCLSVWEKGSASNANVKLTLDASTAGTQNGLFKGNLTPAADFELYAIYPYNAEYGNDPAALALTIPTVVDQSADVNSIVGDSDFMLGKASSKEYDAEKGAYNMLFMHPLAFVQFHIDGRDCIYEQATIKSLTMKADVAFVGAVNVNLEDGTVVSAAQGDEGKTLVINFPATAKMNDPQDAWVAINPVDLSDANCQFILEMTNGQKVTFKVNPNKMNGQALYKFEFKDIDAKITSGKGTPTYVDILSTTGGQRANCYIVSEGGYYKFAAQKVNNKENCFEGTNPYSAGYRANWLWATGTETKVDEVSLGNSGNINFRVKPNANGNTIIALYNPDGEIVWSWHIWCSTVDPMTPNHYARGTDWKLANRNLGALSNEEGKVESYGLMYQWGRKDPFPGPGIIGSTTASSEATIYVTNTQSYVFNETQSVKAFTSVRNANIASVGDIAYSIANPTVNIHYNNANGTTALGNTWLYTTSQTDALKLWNSAGTSRNGKTNYDPCPPGYIVPVSNDYAWGGNSNFWTANLSWESNTTLSGVIFNKDDANNTSYYPAVGYRSAGQLKNNGFACYYWAANAQVDGTNLIARGLSNERSKGANGFNMGGKLPTQYALPIRCMKQ